MVSKQSGKKDVALTNEFHQWLKKKQKWNDKSLEDCLRRLTKFKPRKEMKQK
jgi:hypothetical protein